MKKLSLSFLFAIITAVAFAQTDTIPEKPIIDRTIGKNEIKLNFLYTLALFLNEGSNLTYPEITYERIIKRNFSTGLSVWAMPSEGRDIQIITYIRGYTGKRNNSLFFEGNMGILRSGPNLSVYPPNYYGNTKVKKISIGFGLAAGYKFLQGNGFITEFNLGFGGTGGVFGGYSGIFYPRFGITFGQRF